MLKINNISKKYGNKKVLNNVSFEINKGEIVGFLGLNGAGKSTTMKIIAGCLPPDEGTVSQLHIGYLPENNPLYEDMYVREYLEYVAEIYHPKKKTKEAVDSVIAQVGLTSESHKLISQLSKGYKQRVGLAQAMIHRPEMLILDEPTSGLDPNQMDEINELLINWSSEKAILFSSHILSEVASICTRVIIIHHGEILTDKPVSEIENLEVLFKTLTR